MKVKVSGACIQLTIPSTERGIKKEQPPRLTVEFKQKESLSPTEPWVKFTVTEADLGSDGK